MRGDIAQAFGLAGFASSGGGYVATAADVNEQEEPDWHDLAACRPDLKPDTMTLAAWVGQWFPALNEGLDETYRLTGGNGGPSAYPGREICQGCPVRQTCLEEHLFEQAGMWGGTTPRDRRRLRKQRGLNPRTKGYAAREAAS